MDPLSVAASITGLLTAAGEVAKVLGPYVSAVKETPKIAAQVHSEVQAANIILSALKNLTTNLGSVRVQYAALIQVDQVIAVLADGVLLFSELETAVGSLPAFEPTSPRLPILSRIQWARKEAALTGCLTRLQGFKSSTALILSILQSDSDLRAAQCQEELSINVNELLESNRTLSRRLMNLEDAFDVQTLVSKRQSVSPGTPRAPPSSGQMQSGIDSQTQVDHITAGMSHLSPGLGTVPVSEFENELESSRVYRRAQRDTMDFSFRSSLAGTNAWSVFSGLSLGDISIMSAIALPIYPEDLSNPQRYDFGGFQAAPEVLPSIPAPVDDSFMYKCVQIRLQLCQISGFSELFEREYIPRPAGRDTTAGAFPYGQHPFVLLRAVLRKGYPLLMLFNALDYRWDIPSYRNQHYEQVAAQAVTHFVQACSDMLSVENSSLFSLDDLLQDNNAGFLKVIALIMKVINQLTIAGIIVPVDVNAALPAKTGSGEGKVPMEITMGELIADERSYVRQLEELSNIKDQISKKGLLSDNKIEEIFSPLPGLVNFHLLLLLNLEMLQLEPWQNRRLEPLFISWEGVAATYGHFIANEERNKSLLRSLRKASQSEEQPDASMVTTCLRLISLPSQRLLRYTTYLREMEPQLLDKEPQRSDLQLSTAALQRAMKTINTEISKEELVMAKSDLIDRVEDWKNHKISQFGELYLFGQVDVLTESTGQRRPYNAYIFDTIILMCKEKSLGRAKGSRTPLRYRFLRREPPAQEEAGTMLRLLGRIFITNITDTHTVSKPGSYTYQVWWRGDPGIESFTIIFPTSAMLAKWSSKIGELVARPKERRTEPPFWAHFTPTIENPYAQADEGEDSSEERDNTIQRQYRGENDMEGNWV
ncbi:hypothetical protein GQ53DRAFT_685934 [Thozetella sp. PMI_491]|nr:hypothetical protein GQ53DRAFT_685934 [Thozetella sp. PMI_491]